MTTTSATFRRRKNSPVKSTDELSIIPSIAGGAGASAIAEEALAERATAELPRLSNEEIARYSRHLILPEVGMEGQRKLKAAKVLCVGTGGLGAPLALYLTAAGVGTIGLVDFDVVDESNLQRQVIHSQATVGKLKVDSAELMLTGLNKNVTIVKHNTMLTSANALEIFRDYDVIADGTDKLPDAVPGERCVRADGQAERVRFHLPLRGPGERLRHGARALLSLPVSGAAAAGPGTQLRGGRRARHSARACRRHSGDGGHQADPRHRRTAGRPVAPGGFAGHELPHAEAAQEPELPCLRHA